MPVWAYESRRWLTWLGPCKRWIGDLVRCANPACQMIAMAGIGGLTRIEPKAPVAASPAPDDGAAPDEKPPRREVSAIHDTDMRWYRD